MVRKIPAQGDVLLSDCIRQLEEYFTGSRTAFDLPLDLGGTAFKRRVWEAAKKIPFGTTCAYGELAWALGKPKAARAVGSALAKNPVGFVIPCHRIVQGSGSAGGFAWGKRRKERLLSMERRFLPCLCTAERP